MAGSSSSYIAIDAVTRVVMVLRIRSPEPYPLPAAMDFDQGSRLVGLADPQPQVRQSHRDHHMVVGGPEPGHVLQGHGRSPRRRRAGRRPSCAAGRGSRARSAMPHPSPSADHSSPTPRLGAHRRDVAVVLGDGDPDHAGGRANPRVRVRERRAPGRRRPPRALGEHEQERRQHGGHGVVGPVWPGSVRRCPTSVSRWTAAALASPAADMESTAARPGRPAPARARPARARRARRAASGGPRRRSPGSSSTSPGAARSRAAVRRRRCRAR